jgi:hypothetical protein
MYTLLWLTIKGNRNEYLKAMSQARVPEHVSNHKKKKKGQTGRKIKLDMTTQMESAAE